MELGFTGECQIPEQNFEDAAFYKEQLEIYEKTLDFRQDMADTLGVEEDGWVSPKRWDSVKAAHDYSYGG